jgi:hypothetical protein
LIHHRLETRSKIMLLIHHGDDDRNFNRIHKNVVRYFDIELSK